MTRSSPASSTPPSNPPASSPNPKCNLAWINEQQSRLTEIPAPPFQEAQRAAAVKLLLASSGLEVQIDKTGNVIGELRGANEKEIVVLSAHLDTVFPPSTEIKVRREGDRLVAPGISDK